RPSPSSPVPPSPPPDASACPPEQPTPAAVSSPADGANAPSSAASAPAAAADAPAAESVLAPSCSPGFATAIAAAAVFEALPFRPQPHLHDPSALFRGGVDASGPVPPPPPPPPLLSTEPAFLPAAASEPSIRGLDTLLAPAPCSSYRENHVYLGVEGDEDDADDGHPPSASAPRATPAEALLLPPPSRDS
ncbi:unnamed protein product, partial [Ectocarpus sp. 12 AP-2014]